MARIEIDRVTVTAPAAEGDITILRDVTATLTEQRIALIGANGSGKSTLARLVNGLVSPSAGRIVVDGMDVAHEGAAVRRRVGFVFTQPVAQLVMPTVLEDVALSLRRSIPDKGERERKAREVIEAFGLGERATASVHALSGGQQQLLALAGVLATDPAIVIADEPTTLLDLRNAATIANRLFDLEQQLLLVTHDLDLAARCDRALVIDGGRIAYDGTPIEAIQAYRALAAAP